MIISVGITHLVRGNLIPDFTTKISPAKISPATRCKKVDWEGETAVQSQEEVGHLRIIIGGSPLER